MLFRGLFSNKTIKLYVSFILILFGLFFIDINTLAATWKFEWTNTVVKVPVGAEIEDYRYLPKAYLYKDGFALSDANITYSTEGDWLYFFKDVNSQKVGEYKVWYKAYENEKYSPGTCNGYKCLVTFIVEDTISPIINVYSNEINIRRTNITKSTNDETPEEVNDISQLEQLLRDNVVVTDNYSDCNITFSHNVDLFTVGRYDVTVKASDSSGNISTNNFYVNVFEDREPIITFNGSGNKIKVGLGDEIDFSSYFTAYDYFDGDITKNINYPIYFTNSLGSYEYMVDVFNSANLKATYSIIIEVVDETPPEMELTTHTAILNYEENFNDFNFMKYIKSLRDNVEINYDNLSITHNLENKVGSYQINFSYTDGVYEVSDVIDVKLVSKIRPIIDVNDVVVPINSSINLLDYVLITDYSDPNILESVSIIDDNVNYQKPGTYYASISVINSSGLSTTKKIKIVVEPEISNQNSNLPVIIISSIMIVMTIGYGGFFLYYFVIRKKHKKI